jgi:hypothetical protein
MIVLLEAKNMEVCAGHSQECRFFFPVTEHLYVAFIMFTLNCWQDVLGAMSPPPAPMFMPHGASLDTSSDDVQSPSAERISHDCVQPASAHRYDRIECLFMRLNSVFAPLGFVSELTCVVGVFLRVCVLLVNDFLLLSEVALAAAMRVTRMSIFRWTYNSTQEHAAAAHVVYCSTRRLIDDCDFPLIFATVGGDLFTRKLIT